jgi:hypothetical protein
MSIFELERFFSDKETSMQPLELFLATALARKIHEGGWQAFASLGYRNRGL